MARIIIRINPETAVFLLRALVKTYQDADKEYPRVMTYILYLIFLVNAMAHGWKSVDNSLTMTAVLVAPANIKEMRRGENYYCKVGYYRSGINNIDSIQFPADPYWVKLLIQYHSTVILNGMAETIGLKVAENKDSLANIDHIVERGLG